MRIIDLLNNNGIDLNFNVNSKSEAIDRLVDLMNAAGT